MAFNATPFEAGRARQAGRQAGRAGRADMMVGIANTLQCPALQAGNTIGTGANLG